MPLSAEQLPLIFRIPDSDYSLDPVNHGHINQTFKVLSSGKPVYILQRINEKVFPDVDGLMANYQMVSARLNNHRWSENRGIRVPEIIRTRGGALIFRDPQHGIFRLITYIEGITLDAQQQVPGVAFEAGLAFGLFLKAASGINPVLLYPVLPDFHNLSKRYAQFQSALDSDSVKRAGTCRSEIEQAEKFRPLLCKIPELILSGVIPVRVVHNDTKLSNILFNLRGEASGVIDLDTVMAGSALHDFGDAIRSLANTAEEDEPDLSLVQFDFEAFESFSKGYLEAAGATLTKTETALLAESAMLMTYIIGLRFLTDYLNGDTYYRISYPEHNIVRARVQFRLLQQMMAIRQKMITTVLHLGKSYSISNF